MCEAIAPKVFRLNDNRQSEAVDPKATARKILEAAENCPVSAIFVEDAETGRAAVPVAEGLEPRQATGGGMSRGPGGATGGISGPGAGVGVSGPIGGGISGPGVAGGMMSGPGPGGCSGPGGCGGWLFLGMEHKRPAARGVRQNFTARQHDVLSTSTLGRPESPPTPAPASLWVRLTSLRARRVGRCIWEH